MARVGEGGGRKREGGREGRGGEGRRRREGGRGGGGGREGGEGEGPAGCLLPGLFRGRERGRDCGGREGIGVNTLLWGRCHW